MEYQPPQEIKSSSDLTPQKSSLGMEPNIAAALSYLCGWVTGLIFYLLEKDSNFVRFHAMQSLITFGGLAVLWIALSIITNIPGLGILYWVAFPVLSIAGFVAWVLLILKAYQGERFHFPVTGEMAEKYVK